MSLKSSKTSKTGGSINYPSLVAPNKWKSRLALRRFEERDLPFLKSLYGSIRQPELALTQFTETEKKHFVESQFSAQHFHYCQNYSTENFDIIELDTNPIGRLFVEYRESEIRIVDIALIPEQRKLGVGSFLLQNIFNRAGREGKSVTIHVERNNPARRLYERLGFQVKSSHDEVYLLMEWLQ